jgi:hypothetical protein
MEMIIAAILFALAFILNGLHTTITNPWLTPTSLMLAGLTCLAIHFYRRT